MVSLFCSLIIYDVDTAEKESSSRKTKADISSPTYLESFVAFCDTCFAVLDNLTDSYYKCQSCDDFLACLACVADPKHRLIRHSPEHLFAPNNPRSKNHWMHRNLSITCDICKEKNFVGRRYRCRHCCNYNVCSNCLDEAKRTHFPSEEHIFDFIPNTTKIRFNRLLLARRTQQLLLYRNAGPSERDPITGWTIDEVAIIVYESRNLYWASCRQAKELLTDEDMNPTPTTVEDKDSAKLLISLSTDN